MLKTIDKQSDVKSIEPPQLPKPRWTLVTIFSEELRVPEIALLSEAVLGEHRPRDEERMARPYHKPE